MPLYEYRCHECGKEFEILQKPDQKVCCPSCGGRSLKRLFSVFSSPTVTAGLKSCADELAGCSAERCKSGSCPFSGE